MARYILQIGGEEPVIVVDNSRIACFLTVLLFLPILPLILLCFNFSIINQTSLFSELSSFTGGTTELKLALLTQADVFVAAAIIHAVVCFRLDILWRIIGSVVVLIGYAIIAEYIMHSRYEGGFDRLFFLIPWKELIL